MATWPCFWGPTSLVSANRRVTLLGPPNRWCTNSKAPAEEIESLRIWSTSPTVDIPKPKESLEVLPEMHGPKLPNWWPCCGDVTKETSLHKFKNHETNSDRFMIHGKQNGMYHLSHASCCKPKQNVWELEVLFLLTPPPHSAPESVLQFRYTVDLSFSIFREADSAQIIGRWVK